MSIVFLILKYFLDLSINKNKINSSTLTKTIGFVSSTPEYSYHRKCHVYTNRRHGLMDKSAMTECLLLNYPVKYKTF